MVTIVVAIAGLLLSATIAAFKAISAYGANVQALTTLTGEVQELRKSIASIGERVGRVEARLEAERELTGRHRG
jgi:hypothetical protein